MEPPSWAETCPIWRRVFITAPLNSLSVPDTVKGGEVGSENESRLRYSLWTMCFSSHEVSLSGRSDSELAKEGLLESDEKVKALWLRGVEEKVCCC